MNIANFKVGDVIRVFTKDPQDNKVHATPFEGIVISLRGQKDTRTFIVRKRSTDGVFVERIFPALSPSIEKITVVKSGSFRRAKLYYLRKTK
jgi:large subunit ribosomal protein L19